MSDDERGGAGGPRDPEVERVMGVLACPSVRFSFFVAMVSAGPACRRTTDLWATPIHSDTASPLGGSLWVASGVACPSRAREGHGAAEAVSNPNHATIAPRGAEPRSGHTKERAARGPTPSYGVVSFRHD
jgi:hypothetical protein